MAKRRIARKVGVLAVPALFVVLLGAYLWINAEQREANPLDNYALRGTGEAFQLVDQQGDVRKGSDFRGRWMLITFGYTYCPDVCPTTLNTMTVALDILRRREVEVAEDVVPVFVSIDPERDTVAALADYAPHFHPRLVTLTGSPEQVAEAAEHFGVQYRKVGSSGSQDYLMDHTAFIHLIGPDGGYVAQFKPSITPEKLAGAIAKLTTL